MIAIDKGVPYPPEYIGYPFQRMSVGDSFIIPKGKEKSVMSLKSREGKSMNAKFIVSKLPEDEFFRCWRVK